MTSPQFDSAFRRIESAARHLASLKLQIRRYANAGPLKIKIEDSDDGLRDVHKVKLAIPVPPQVEDAVFDVLSNLRAALDNATYASCVLLSGDAVDFSNGTYFPFGDDEKEIRSRRGAGSKRLHQEIFDFCAGVGPHIGGEHENLWALNKARNCSQHRYLTRIAPDLSRWPEVHISIQGTASYPVWDPAKEEAVLCEANKGTQPIYRFEAIFDVVFDGIECLQDYEVIDSLEDMLTSVTSVVNAIRAQSFRLHLVR